MQRQRDQSRRRLITLGSLLAVAVLLLVVGQRSGVLRPVMNAITTPLQPITRLLTRGADAATNLTEETEDYDTLVAQNREYERTIAQLQVELVRLREIERDYDRLAALVDYQTQNPDQNLVAADVIARDTSGYQRWIFVNRGTRDGVLEGNPVITDLGLVGRVELVTANGAWVRLAIDQASAVNARLQNARAEGTVTGLLQGGMRMDFIPQSAVVEQGDIVVTSGLGGSYPANIVIGLVSSVQKQQSALFQQAEIRPTVNYDELDIVGIITTFEPVDTSALDEALEGEPAP